MSKESFFGIEVGSGGADNGVGGVAGGVAGWRCLAGGGGGGPSPEDPDPGGSVGLFVVVSWLYSGKNSMTDEIVLSLTPVSRFLIIDIKSGFTTSRNINVGVDCIVWILNNFTGSSKISTELTLISPQVLISNI